MLVLNFGDRLQTDLLAGSILIQPGSGKGSVTFPSHGGGTATVEGSRMIAQVEQQGIWLLCMEGECSYTPVEGDVSYPIKVNQKRMFNFANKQMDAAVDIPYDEKWKLNEDCSYCISDIVPTPTPVPTKTPIPYGGAFEWNQINASLLGLEHPNLGAFISGGGWFSSGMIFTLLVSGLYKIILSFLRLTGGKSPLTYPKGTTLHTNISRSSDWKDWKKP